MSAFVGVADCLFGEGEGPCRDDIYKCDRFGQMLQPVPPGEHRVDRLASTDLAVSDLLTHSDAEASKAF